MLGTSTKFNAGSGGRGVVCPLFWLRVLEGDRFLMSIFILRSRFGWTAALQPVAQSSAGTPGEGGEECRGGAGRTGVQGSAGGGWTWSARLVPSGRLPRAHHDWTVVPRWPRAGARRLAQPWRLQDQLEGARTWAPERGLGELPRGVWDPRDARRAGAGPAVAPELERLPAGAAAARAGGLE